MEVEAALAAFSKALELAAGDKECEAGVQCLQAIALVAARRCPDALMACMQVSFKLTKSVLATPQQHLQLITSA